MTEILGERSFASDSDNEVNPLVENFTINELLVEALDNKASDLHITVGMPPLMRVNGLLSKMRDEILLPEHTESICHGLLSDAQKETLTEYGEIDFSYSIPNVSRW